MKNMSNRQNFYLLRPEKYLHYEHKQLGYNYRLSNLLASIGNGQISRLDAIVESRRNIFEHYYKNLGSIDGIDFLIELENCKSNRWLTTFTINQKKLNVSRDDIINALSKDNIESRPVWKPMH